MSLKGDKYETLDEIRFRLENTVVVYDGRPVFITKAAIPEAEDGKEIARVYFQELPYKGRGKEVRKFLSSKKFDLTPIKLGYFNHEGASYYVSRAPIRQNRQGLCANTTQIGGAAAHKLEKFGDMGRIADRMDYNVMVGSQGFVDMFDNKYPSFKDVGDMLTDGEFSSVAVSRKFSFVIDRDLDALILMHKKDKCGLAFTGDRGIRLPNKFHFLREAMEESRIPIA